MSNKIIVDKKLYLSYYNRGLSDTTIAPLMNISNATLSRFRNTLGLTPNRAKTINRSYKSINLDESQYQTLLGTLLGDGGLELSVKAKAKNARLKLGHSTKQVDYFNYKVSKLSELFKALPKVSDTKEGYEVIHIGSISHPLLTELFNKLYVDGRKSITESIINELTAEGLAVLFMDDGYCERKSQLSNIALCGFTEEECNMFCNVINVKFGLTSRILIKSGYRYIFIPANSRGRFRDVVRPYIVPSMLYKIGEYS
jgi:recombination protein RecA